MFKSSVVSLHVSLYKEKNGAESTKDIGTSDIVRTSSYNNKVKDTVNWKEKAKTWTWSDVVKGLKTEDELETANSDKCPNKLDTPIHSKCSIGRSQINQR